MQRTTISVPDNVSVLLKREARRRQLSVAAVAREAIEDHFCVGKTEKRRVGFAALGSSGRTDIARNIDEALAEAGFPDRHR